MVLSLLLFASLTALLVLAPRVQQPLAPRPLLGGEQAPPAAEGSYAADLDTGAVGAEEDGADDLALFRRVTLDSGEGAALLDDPANAYFALLSQHCVPLHSFPYLHATLFPATAAHHHRLPSYIEVLADEPQMLGRYEARGGEGAMLPEVPFARFRIGSQFFTLARRHAVLVVRERRLWRKFREPCLPESRLHSCYPEEHYFPTLLDMADPAGVARYTLTRVNWTGSFEGHPHRYAAPEVTPRLVAELRRSNGSDYEHMFARKFAPDCLGPLLAMADSVIFKD